MVLSPLSYGVWKDGNGQERIVAKRKTSRQEVEVTVWPSGFPEDVGSIAPSDSSLDSDELGSHFLHDAAELHHGTHGSWAEDVDEPYFDEQMGKDLLRSLGLKPMPKRTSLRPAPGAARTLPKLRAPRMPEEFLDYFAPSNDVDLTDASVRDASLLDHEAEEAGEVESPNVRTDDVHTHGKPRGGHARTSLRPPSRQR
jgi:hypothetical protein